MNAKENYLRAIRHDRPEWVPFGFEAVYFISSPVVERPGQAGLDAFGVRWNLEENAEGGTYPAVDGHPVTDIGRWRSQVTFPDVNVLDWPDVRRRAAEVDRDEKLIMGFVEMGIFERSYLLLGMENALMAYIEEPERMEEIAAAIADYKITLMERFDDEVDLDLVWYGDDWGTQESLFVSPDVWRRFVKPPTRRVYEAMKKRGVMIHQHSCGKIDAILGDVVEMGATTWEPCQPCNPLAELKRLYGGRLAFSGGIDSQFVLDRPGTTPEEVRAEVRRRIDEMAEGGGYVAYPSHSVPYNQELLNAMTDEIAVYGRNYYAR